jgi:acyl-CoA thioesterase-2
MTEAELRTASTPEGPIVSLLELDQLDTDEFRTTQPSLLASADARGDGAAEAEDRRRVFGGQLVAQAMRAGSLTVPAERGVHSIHAYFVTGAAADAPLDFHVERVRDGGRISNRRVVCRQRGREILSLQASYQDATTGSDRADPAPARLGEWASLEDASGEAAHTWSGVRMRFSPWSTPASGDGSHEIHRRVWMRVDEPVPDDPQLAACVLAYASDLTLLRTALLAETIAEDGGLVSGYDSGLLRLASLDHAMWFHRATDLSQWLLLTGVAPSTSNTRALTLGHLHDEGGRLLATTVQEGVVRRRD